MEGSLLFQKDNIMPRQVVDNCMNGEILKNEFTYNIALCIPVHHHAEVIMLNI
jgi:hypothetical protein